MEILRNSYVLAVPDAEATAAFFIEKLGFETSWKIEGQWHTVKRDGCGIMMGTCVDAIPPKDLGDHSWFAYIHVSDIDEFHADLSTRGLDVARPQSKPWGLREMLVTTPDGHRIVFGQLLNP